MDDRNRETMRKKGQHSLRKHSLVAKKIITSNELAEKFIKRWISRKNTNRKDAIERLRQLGVQYPKPKTITGFLKRVA